MTWQKSKLIGRRVYITNRDSIYFDEWGIVDAFDGDWYYVRIAADLHSTVVFKRDEFRAPRKGDTTWQRMHKETQSATI